MLSGGCCMNLFPEKSSSVRHPAVLTIPTPIILHWSGYFSGGNCQFSSLFSPAWWHHWRHQFCCSQAQTGSQATGQDRDALTLAVHCTKHHPSYEHNPCLGNSAALILTSLVNITATTCCSSAAISHQVLVPHCKLTSCYPLCSAKILWAQLPPSWPCLLHSTGISPWWSPSALSFWVISKPCPQNAPWAWSQCLQPPPCGLGGAGFVLPQCNVSTSDRMGAAREDQVFWTWMATTELSSHQQGCMTVAGEPQRNTSWLSIKHTQPSKTFATVGISSKTHGNIRSATAPPLVSSC